MNNKTLAYFGIGMHIQSVLASATDLRGEPRVPFLLILAIEIAVMVFVVTATKRLWSKNRALAVALPGTQIALFSVAAFGLGVPSVDGSFTVLSGNVVRVIALLVLAITILTLFRMPEVLVEEGGVNPVVASPRASEGSHPTQSLDSGEEIGASMTLDQAHHVVDVWASYLEYCQDKLRAVFGTGIPQSLLPYPFATMEKALNMVAEDYHNRGDQENSTLIQESFRCLACYTTDDDTALSEAAVKFAIPEVREAVVANVRRVQREWLASR